MISAAKVIYRRGAKVEKWKGDGVDPILCRDGFESGQQWLDTLLNFTTQISCALAYNNSNDTFITAIN